MPVRHYYHVYAGGAWAQPVTEHVQALGSARLHTDMTVGLAGPGEDRAAARMRIAAHLAERGLPGPVRWTEADTGWEQVTLQQIHSDVHQIPGEFAVLYAHTKGAYTVCPANDRWRRSMTNQLVGGWERCTELLRSYDATGCHWVTNKHGEQFFGGNFWWARASHLRTLPPPDNDNRWTAETWVSLGACPGHGGLPAPRIYDLLPGWPAYES